MRVCYGEAWFDLQQTPSATLQLAAVDIKQFPDAIAADPLLKALCLALRNDVECSGLVGDTRQGLQQASETLHERGAWLSSIDVKINCNTLQEQISDAKEQITAALAKLLSMPIGRINISLASPPMAVLPEHIIEVKVHTLVGESK